MQNIKHILTLLELRRMDCYNWYVTGHKKGKYRRTYSYIREEDGNTSHRLMRYAYDFAWESNPGLRVIHYISGDPRHQIQSMGKKPNYEVSFLEFSQICIDIR